MLRKGTKVVFTSNKKARCGATVSTGDKGVIVKRDVWEDGKKYTDGETLVVKVNDHIWYVYRSAIRQAD